MPKTHPADTAKIAYRIKPPSVWRSIRAEWEAGAVPADLSRRFDVSASSVRARREREGWSRDGMLGSGSTVGGAGSRTAAGAGDDGVEVTALRVNEIALAAALRSLAHGRAEEALAIVRAGDRVACYAEFVAAMRADDAGTAGERVNGASAAAADSPEAAPRAPGRRAG